MIDDPELRQLFKAESEEHLSQLDDGLLRLEKTPTEPALLEELFRDSHSLKGAARMLGLVKVETSAHGLETILNAARKGEAPLTPDTIERMNAALGDLRRHVQEAFAGAPAVASLQVSDALSAASPHPNPPPHAEEEVNVPTPTVVELEREVVPPPLREGRGWVGVGALPANEPFRIETVRVETRKLDDLLTQAGELSVIEGRARHRLALMEELTEQWAALQRGWRKRGAESEASACFGKLLKQARDALFDDGARLESTVKLLEDQVRGIRLLPLSTVFALFPRMVRDLAMAQGKEVELAIEGGDITVDKRILEEMKDPLMHLIRNAIDHGIEPPSERERLGKPRGGAVRLRASRENSSVLLEVQDDGRGLDLATIRQEARKRGLLDEAALAAATPVQLQQLILLSGFSTSAFVTELSGRGVGLDVVRANVERMKGAIHLESAAGQGLTVRLRLPLSLATTRILLVSAGGRSYGLPVEFVVTSRRVRMEDIFTLEGRAAVLLDGQPVIAAHLADLLTFPHSNPPPHTIPQGLQPLVDRSPLGRYAQGRELQLPPPRAGEGWGGGSLVCIIIQLGDERLGLLADDLLAEEEVVPKPLGAPLRRVRNVSALAMLGSGEICTVLNPADLLRSAHNADSPLHSGEHEIRHDAARPAVLLVEDSALIRAMEMRILGDGGYEVVAAVDGVDALNVLGSRPFAAVVSDIMMPNMDGLSLTARIRAEPRYKDLPVILVTTLASDEDKRRGLDAGANAYIPKPSFDQRILLDTLKRLIVT